MSRGSGLLWGVIGVCLWAAAVGFKPVIIVHGLFDSSGDFLTLSRFINEVRHEQNPPLVCVCSQIETQLSAEPPARRWPLGV